MDNTNTEKEAEPRFGTGDVITNHLDTYMVEEIRERLYVLTPLMKEKPEASDFPDEWVAAPNFEEITRLIPEIDSEFEFASERP